MVDIAPVAEMKAVSLDELRQNGDLEGMALLARGQRLSVQPVEEEHFRIVCQMGGIDSTSIGR
jgi:predicted RNA-binding protein with PUA-like domain